MADVLIELTLVWTDVTRGLACEFLLPFLSVGLSYLIFP